MADDQYADYIEWWENYGLEDDEEATYDWHAKSNNGKILFGSKQGYENHATMLQYISSQFPELEIRRRDGEPASSVETAHDDLREKGQVE